MIILANSITADMGFVPGLAMISPLFGFPLSLIAAIIERPYYTAAGVTKHTVWYSIRANIRSLLVGYLMMVVGFLFVALGEAFFLFVWPAVAVATSTFVEGRYLQKCVGPERKLQRGWIIIANVFSAFACVLILVPVAILETEANKRMLRPYQLPLSLLMLTICVAAIVMSYVIPKRSRCTTETAAADPLPSPPPAYRERESEVIPSPLSG